MASEQKDPRSRMPNRFVKWLPLLTEVWIFAVITIFFVVRILGSNTAKHFLHKAGY